MMKSRAIDLRLNGTIQYQRSGYKVQCVVQYITMDFTDAVVITSDPRICAGEDIILNMTPPFRRATITCTGRVTRRSESDGLFEFFRGYLARISINYISPTDKRKLELVLAQEKALINPGNNYRFKQPITLTTDVEAGIRSLKDSLAKIESTLKQQARIIEEASMLDIYNILVVDDEVPHLNALKRTLRNGYNVLSATSGEDALSIMEESDISFIIADHLMPGMTGVEFLEKTLEKHPNIIRMILTAHTDRKLLIDAINRVHIHKFMSKPWDPENMKATVKAAIESFEMAHAHILGEQVGVGIADDMILKPAN